MAAVAAVVPVALLYKTARFVRSSTKREGEARDRAVAGGADAGKFGNRACLGSRKQIFPL
jgi:hypothetical protein